MLPALLCALLSWLYSMPSAFFSGQSVVLASPVSWGLHCSLGFTSTASCEGFLGPLCRDPNPDTHYLVSAALWNVWRVRSSHQSTSSSGLVRRHSYRPLQYVLWLQLQTYSRSFLQQTRLLNVFPLPLPAPNKWLVYSGPLRPHSNATRLCQIVTQMTSSSIVSKAEEASWAGPPLSAFL